MKIATSELEHLREEVKNCHRIIKNLQKKREFVGLTHSDIDQGLLRSDYAFKTAEAWRAGVVFAMTKLKQKNGYDS